MKLKSKFFICLSVFFGSSSSPISLFCNNIYFSWYGFSHRFFHFTSFLVQRRDLFRQILLFLLRKYSCKSFSKWFNFRRIRLLILWEFYSCNLNSASRTSILNVHFFDEQAKRDKNTDSKVCRRKFSLKFIFGHLAVGR